MKTTGSTAIMALLLAFLGAGPIIAQTTSTASHTVTISILPAVTIDADAFVRFGLPRDGKAGLPTVAEIRPSLAVQSTLEVVRLAIGLSKDSDADIQLRLADESGNWAPLSTTSTQVDSGPARAGKYNLNIEAKIGEDWFRRYESGSLVPCDIKVTLTAK